MSVSLEKVSAPAVRNRRTSLHIGLILLVGVLARIPFYLGYKPIWSGDSVGYLVFYRYLTQHLFFLGWRTPVYPFFLGFARWLGLVTSHSDSNPNPNLAYWATCLQSVSCILAAALLYYMLRLLRVPTKAVLVASLFFATIPAVCMFELNILNMALSFSLQVLVVCLFLATINRLETGRSITVPALATGVAASLSVLNRPDLLIFVILLLSVMVVALLRCWYWNSAGPSLLKAATLIAFPVCCAVLSWMLLMYVGIGEFRITTATGWNRARTVYNLFDRVDPEDRVIGEIMSRTYNNEVRANANVNLRETMWPALDELFPNYKRFPIADTATDPGFLDHRIIRAGRHALGLIQIPCPPPQEIALQNYCWESMRRTTDVGDYLGTVSWKLARKYPGDWLHNVVANFFEESFNFRYMDEKPAIESPRANASDEKENEKNGTTVLMTTGAINVEAPVLTLMYMVTLGFFILSPVVLFRKPDQYWLRDTAVCALAVASVGTIVGTCVLAGFNRVYTLPHLVVFTVCAAYAWEHRSRITKQLRHWNPRLLQTNTGQPRIRC